MSEFSKRLEEYIRLSGYTIYSFAKYTGINRTSLNKITMDRRVPTLDYVKNICNYLKVSDEKKQELIFLYNQEKYGADTVATWKSIKGFFEEFYYQPIDSDNIRQGDPYITHIPSKIFMEPRTVTDSREILIDIILDEINGEDNPELYMDVSWASSSILQFICQRSLWKDIQVHVYMNLNQLNVRGGSVHNFESIKQILQSVFYMGKNLDARYVYVNDATDGRKYGSFEHYIITHKRVVLFSEDDWKIKIISDLDIAQAFITRQIVRMDSFRTLLLKNSVVEKLETKSDSVERLYLGRSVNLIQSKTVKLIFFLRISDEKIAYVVIDTPEVYREFDEFFFENSDMENLYQSIEAVEMLKKIVKVK